MNPEALRALQAPLKAQYKQDPARALITLLKLTERYCVVYPLRGGAGLETSYEAKTG